jgi:hypothetical protein
MGGASGVDRLVEQLVELVEDERLLERLGSWSDGQGGRDAR